MQHSFRARAQCKLLKHTHTSPATYFTHPPLIVPRDLKDIPETSTLTSFSLRLSCHAAAMRVWQKRGKRWKCDASPQRASLCSATHSAHQWRALTSNSPARAWHAGKQGTTWALLILSVCPVQPTTAWKRCFQQQTFQFQLCLDTKGPNICCHNKHLQISFRTCVLFLYWAIITNKQNDFLKTWLGVSKCLSGYSFEHIFTLFKSYHFSAGGIALRVL